MTIMGNEITDGAHAKEDNMTWYEQAVSMISDIVWRYDVDTKGEHVGTYISPVADRILGLPDGTIGNSFDKYLTYVLPIASRMDGLQSLARQATLPNTGTWKTR